MGVKAAGSVRNAVDAGSLLRAGPGRIGPSSARTRGELVGLNGPTAASLFT